MPWAALEQALLPHFPATPAGGGRPALPVRLIAGLLYLKHADDLSDEAVCERWLENPYWQFFTGEVVFQTRLPCDVSSLTRWRQRLGEAGMEELLAHTINVAHAMQAVGVKVGIAVTACKGLAWVRAASRATRTTGIPWPSSWSRHAGCCRMCA